MNHPNAAILEKLYRDFSDGNYEAVLNACSDACTFQLAGKSRLAGKYDKKNFISGFVTKLKELSSDTFQIDAHDIMGSDRHGVVLASEKLVRDGKTVEYRVVHVWRFEGGKPVAWYEYPRDLYQYDSLWA